MRRRSLSRTWLTTAFVLALGASLTTAIGCSDSSNDDPSGAGGSGGQGDELDGGSGGDGDTDADAEVDGGDSGSPVESIPLSETIEVPGLNAPVDLVRDEWGVPHIYGTNASDVAFAQGYIVARDRFPQMDFMRHSAGGTLTELAGVLVPQVLQADLNMRIHQFRKGAEEVYDELKASTDPSDKALVAFLDRFADGVNEYLTALKAKKFSLPKELQFAYNADHAKPWTAVDSLLLGQLQAYSLSYDAEREIVATLLRAQAHSKFDEADEETSPDLARRSGFFLDITSTAPIDPTFTSDGWPGIVPTKASKPKAPPPRTDALYLQTLENARRAIEGTGMNERGSNNWVVGKAHSATGNVLLANDPHLTLSNPATFYMAHLSSRGDDLPLNAMGVAFPGIPGLVLGMNDKLAWGATTSYADVTDVYSETIVDCDESEKPCVVFNGNKVPLVPRVEEFGIGVFGDVKKTLSITLWDVPHHGPILVRANAKNDGIQPLTESELSVRYTGHQSAQLLRAMFGVNTAKTVTEAMGSLEKDFDYGGQNWVFGDADGHIGWTQTSRIPKRAPGHAPWLVLPGDGSAEWRGDMDKSYVPHEVDPARGYIATANNDPIGVTKNDDPFFGQPIVDGSPLYMGAYYEAGPRIGRITKRLEAATAGGKKVSLDDMQSIQADAYTEYGEMLAPTLLDAAKAMIEEASDPGTHAELSALLAGASDKVKALIPVVTPWLEAWSFDTPSGAAEENPTEAQIRDSQATVVFTTWFANFFRHTLNDELSSLQASYLESNALKLVVFAATTPEQLATEIASETGDSILFDDLTTPGVIESKRYIAAKALISALNFLTGKLGDDASAWRWGQLHTVTLEFFVANDGLKVPLTNEYENGFPRHGGIGTVDVAGHVMRTDDFTNDHGAAMRFVCEMTPNGPKARNVLPGGQVFDPESPHYRDQMELWRKNQTFDLAFTDSEVVESAQKEWEKNKLGRIRFVPR